MLDELEVLLRADHRSRVAGQRDDRERSEDGVERLRLRRRASPCGRTREEARANVIDALRGILELRFGGHPEVTEGADSEPLELVIGA